MTEKTLHVNDIMKMMSRTDILTAGEKFQSRDVNVRQIDMPLFDSALWPSDFDDLGGTKLPRNSESFHVGASITDKNIIALYNKINEWSKKG